MAGGVQDIRYGSIREHRGEGTFQWFVWKSTVIKHRPTNILPFYFEICTYIVIFLFVEFHLKSYYTCAYPFVLYSNDVIFLYNVFLYLSFSIDADGFPVLTGICELPSEEMRLQGRESVSGSIHCSMCADPTFYWSIQNTWHTTEWNRYHWIWRFPQCSSELLCMRERITRLKELKNFTFCFHS